MILRHLVKTWKHHSGLQLTSLIVMTASLSVILFFFLLSQNFSRLVTFWGNEFQLTAYLVSTAKHEDVQDLIQKIQENPSVQNIGFISQEDSIRSFQNQMNHIAGDLIKDVDVLKLIPASLEVRLKEDIPFDQRSVLLANLAEQVKQSTWVDEVTYGQDWIQRYAQFVKGFQSLGGLISILLVAGVFFVISNSLQTSIDQRREELEVLEIIGAGRWTIRGPFLFEALFLSLVASFLAMILDFVVFDLLAQEMRENLALVSIAKQVRFLNLSQLAAFLAVAVFVTISIAYLRVRSINTGWSTATTTSFVAPIWLPWVIVAGLMGFHSASIAGSGTHLTEHYLKTKQKLLQQEQEQRRLLGALFELNRKQRRAEQERTLLEQDAQVLEMTIEDINGKIKELDQQLNGQKDFLKKRVRSIYRVSQQGVLKIILSSEKMNDLDRNMRILSQLMRNDLQLIRNYRSTFTELDGKKKKLALRMEKLQKLQKQHLRTERRLVEQNELKKKLLKKIKDSALMTEEKLAVLKEKINRDQNADQGWIDLLSQAPFSDLKGQLPYPLNAKIYQGFGVQRDPFLKIAFAHKGLFFATDHDQTVFAVASGKVAYQGLMDGWGQVLVLDHGDHYYTVYAGTKDAVVALGDQVQPQQKIASTGFSEIHGTQGIYFEIRHFSEPYDPKSWLKGPSL